MVIHKILNNNLILSRDGQGHEVIVKGCGIAFQKKKGQQVEESRIEKIFTAENAQISKEIQGYLTAIPEKYLDFVEAFVNEVKEKEGMKLNDSIYFSLSDHIMGAISRLENGIRLQNMLLLDIKQLYHKEYEIGLELLKKVNEMFEVDLSADEAGFFALHFVNAEDGGKTDSYQISIIVHPSSSRSTRPVQTTPSATKHSSEQTVHNRRLAHPLFYSHSSQPASDNTARPVQNLSILQTCR